MAREAPFSTPSPPDIGIAPRAPASWRRLALGACAVWLATRVAYLLFTYFAVLFRFSAPSQTRVPVPPRALLGSWLQWDAKWYLGIAQHGYFSAQSTAFFPLYPLLTKAASLALGAHWLLAALLVSNLGTLAAYIGLALLAAYEYGDDGAVWRTLRVTAAYPLAFFLAAPYTDGLFLACAVFAFLAARRGAWRWAALCALLAGLARPTGVILVAPLLYEYGRQRGLWERAAWQVLWRTRTPERLRALAYGLLVASAPLWGIALYAAYLWQRFGDPLLFAHAEQRYWRHTSITSLHVAHGAAAASHLPAFSPWTYWFARQLVDPVPVLLFAVLTLLLARRMPLLYTLYMIGLIALAVASPRPDRLGLVVSAGRYLTASFPLFLALGQQIERRPWLDTLWTSAGWLAQAVFASFFLAGGWMV